MLSEKQQGVLRGLPLAVTIALAIFAPPKALVP